MKFVKYLFSLIIIISFMISCQTTDSLIKREEAVLEFKPPLPRLEIKGSNLVTPDGEPVWLRGCNLGNWLVPEGYIADRLPG